MRLRVVLITTAMSLSFVSANAFKTGPPSPLITEDKIIQLAYYDTLSILGVSNKCSDFFGGPERSVEVFNDLMVRVKKDYFSPNVAIKMSGKIMAVSSLTTNNKYRLFDQVSINANGPFFRQRISESQAYVAGVGTFQPNTREARVLMFLHELGHAIQVEDGKWLLPNDGQDAELSRKNTRTVESVCGAEIRGLAKGDAATPADSGKQQDKPPALLETTP